MRERISWERFKDECWWDKETGFRLDLSRMMIPQGYFSEMDRAVRGTIQAMVELESGATANPDEGRMVGHYWLRRPEAAPSQAIGRAITETVDHIESFARGIHRGNVIPAKGGRFTKLLLAGIGGSALGPMFVSNALATSADPLSPHFLDNTDPDGIDRVLAGIGDELAHTLTVVVSKSGSTPETRNAMLEVAEAYGRAGLDFGGHAVAVTGEGSVLHKYASDNGFLDVFPMWDWVGGRTSELSAVGLLPAALQGFDIRSLLDGARLMDVSTRCWEIRRNPAMLLALAWYHAGMGRGRRAMVVIPYCDRLSLFSRYLQQLVMESLGKRTDLNGRPVFQGLTVYGNKGSTDQHAYVQQLRDGLRNFFLTFIQVLQDRKGESLEVEEGITTGDYLGGFLLGTRKALAEAGRPSITLTLPAVTARSIGMLIALFERAVGFYAGLVNINAYHQPGVEAGKQAAEDILELQRRILGLMNERRGKSMTVEAIAAALDHEDGAESIFHILERLATNRRFGVSRRDGLTPFENQYKRK